MHLPFVNIIIFMARQIVLKFTVDALILSILFSDNILVCIIYCQLEKTKHKTKQCQAAATTIIFIWIKLFSKIPTWTRRFFFSDSEVRTRSLRALFSASSLSFCSLARCSFIISMKRQSHSHEYLRKITLYFTFVVVLFLLVKPYNSIASLFSILHIDSMQ